MRNSVHGSDWLNNSSHRSYSANWSYSANRSDSSDRGDSAEGSNSSDWGHSSYWSYSGKSFFFCYSRHNSRSFILCYSGHNCRSFFFHWNNNSSSGSRGIEGNSNRTFSTVIGHLGHKSYVRSSLISDSSDSAIRISHAVGTSDSVSVASLLPVLGVSSDSVGDGVAKVVVGVDVNDSVDRLKHSHSSDGCSGVEPGHSGEHGGASEAGK